MAEPHQEHTRNRAEVDPMVIRPMVDDDFEWAAELMAQRRRRYEEYSPVFWRPAAGIEAGHAQFLRATASGDRAIALRSDEGFVIGTVQPGRCVVDDFAVAQDDQWSRAGRELLLAVWAATPSSERNVLRVVTARRDEPKRDMLRSLGLEVAERWWVKELTSVGVAGTWGPVEVAGIEALLVPAPPVYDPGGPVCLLGDVDPALAESAAEAAAELGAVLAVVQRQTDPHEREHLLEQAGFHNPSEFYEGSILT